MIICPILSNKFSNIQTNGLNFNAFKDFSLASMAFVKNGGKKGGSFKHQAVNHETLWYC